MSAFAEAPSLAHRISELAQDNPNVPVYTRVSVGGSTQVLTWSWLDRRASQVTAAIAYMKGRLAAYKVPKTVELVQRIPRSEATKVNRGALVEARDG